MYLRIQAWTGQIDTENPPAFRIRQNSAFSPHHSHRTIFFSQNLRFWPLAPHPEPHLHKDTTASRNLRQRKFAFDITGYTFAS
jgi:hypothetical protein